MNSTQRHFPSFKEGFGLVTRIGGPDAMVNLADCLDFCSDTGWKKAVLCPFRVGNDLSFIGYF
jgi:hypothetical protein